MTQRPNILFCIADDQSWPHASAYGCPWVNTPAFDRIAREGILFNNAFTPNAKCAPSRAAILTGRYSWQLQEACNHLCFFPSDYVTYPELFKDAGYATGFTGKGWGPGEPGTYPDGSPRKLVGPEHNDLKLNPPTKSIANIDYAANFAAFLNAKPDDQPFCFISGKERHDICRPGTVGYPIRGIRDHHHLYLRNFEPDRWPAGNPEVYYRNIDDSPTKTRVVEEKEQGNETYWQLCMGKRPKEELYDIQTDPHCITNLAESADHQTIKNALWQKLQKTLKQHGDPRMEGRGHIFDEYPVTNPEQEQRVKERFRIARETGILFKSN